MIYEGCRLFSGTHFNLPPLVGSAASDRPTLDKVLKLAPGSQVPRSIHSEENLGPALEIGCGTGRLTIPYLEAGLDVEGLDSSGQMLEICRTKAAARGLLPVLHQ